MPRVRECHHDLLEAELTRRVIEAFYRVYDTLGYGFLAPVYTRAMELELVRLGIQVARDVPVDVRFSGQVVGVFRADLLVESRLVLGFAASARLDGSERVRLLNHLRCTDLELGLLFHFGPRPAFRRIVSTHPIPLVAGPRQSAFPAASPASASAGRDAVPPTERSPAPPAPGAVTAALPPLPGPCHAPPPGAYPSP